MNAIANWLGYVLNFIYGIVQNYGLAIILFSILIRLVILPITIKQQNSAKKQSKIQEETKKLQIKYANNPEKMNKEVMDMYKREKFNPFSGCLSSIIQLVLFISVFYLVSRPLTFMKKVDTSVIDDYKFQISQEQKTNYPEIQIIDLFGKTDDRVNLNMNFLNLDLSKVPSQNYNDPKVYIIPTLYVILTFINIKITQDMMVTPEMKKRQEEAKLKEEEERKKKKEAKEKKKEFEKELKKAKKEDKALVKEESVEEKEETEESVEDMQQDMSQMTKSMNYMMPILSISIAIIAPLGLSLYWLVSIILQMVERFVIKAIMNKKEKAEKKEA